jgi:four helix bundle protein
MVKKYSDLIVWQKAMDLAVAIYRYSEKFQKEERYGLTAQLRAAGVSVPSNIAEGYGQITTKNYARHIGIARGSLYEAETQILIASRLQYLKKTDVDELTIISSEVGRLINGMLKSLRIKSRQLSTRLLAP